MHWSANALSALTSDTEPTIVLEFDSAKYIFNVGENTIRTFVQSRQNFKKTRGLFLTSVGSQRAGGLAGILMTLADSNQHHVDVIGPEGITHFMASMRRYAYRPTLAVKPAEVPLSGPIIGHNEVPPSCYQDENVAVYAVPIINGEPTARPNQVSSQSLSKESSSPERSKRTRAPSPLPSPKYKRPRVAPTGSTQSRLPETTPSVHELCKTYGFNPSHLQGSLADDWRAFMVQTTFSRQRPLGLETGEGKSTRSDSSPRQQKFGRVKLEEDVKPSEQGFGSTPMNTPTLHHVRRPHGFQHQLPPFSLPLPHANTSESKPTLAYVVVGPRVRGKFDADKAKALCVPNGKIRGQLTSGKEIRFMVEENGEQVERVVKPEQVIGESEVPSVVIILDTPTLGHISSLTSSFMESSFLSQLRGVESGAYVVRVIFHMCGDGVLEDERYKAFMRGFGPDVRHVVASKEHSPDPVTFTTAAFSQLRLNQLDPEIFRIPTFSTEAKRTIESVSDLPRVVSVLRSNTRYGVRPMHDPRLLPGAEEGDRFHPAIQSPEDLSLPFLTNKEFTEAKEAVARVSNGSGPATEHLPGSNIVVTPLGTSSAVPTKYRNVSSTLIQIPGIGNVMLDAGEGTWGQLVRHFGTDSSTSGASSVWDVLRNLKCIFISHLHADHHLGLAKILAMRRQLSPPPEQPLYLVAHHFVFMYLHEHSDLEDLGLDDANDAGVKCVLSDAIHVWPRPLDTFSSRSDNRYPWQDVSKSQALHHELCQTLGMEQFAPVPVSHTAWCHGLVMKHSDGWSITFSGDTIPDDNLIVVGTGSTLLIHEASMGDDELGLAQAKSTRHSTFGQALDVGRRMKAANILLTHFSARYPTMPPSGVPAPLDQDGTTKEATLGLAFDNTNIAIRDMWKMNFYLRAIEQSFKDPTEEADDDEIPHVEMDIH